MCTPRPSDGALKKIFSTTNFFLKPNIKPPCRQKSFYLFILSSGSIGTIEFALSCVMHVVREQFDTRGKTYGCRIE